MTLDSREQEAHLYPMFLVPKMSLWTCNQKLISTFKLFIHYKPLFNITAIASHIQLFISIRRGLVSHSSKQPEQPIPELDDSCQVYDTYTSANCTFYMINTLCN